MTRFVEKWTSHHYPPETVSEADLGLVEKAFGVRLPEDYRTAVLQVGLPRPTIALLDAIVERELDLFCVADFFSASEIIEDTHGWREIGMPVGLIAFASDGGGNKFCFDADRLNTEATDSAAIWFFDHDFNEVDVVAPNFTAWIDAYCDVEPWPDTDSA